MHLEAEDSDFTQAFDLDSMSDIGNLGVMFTSVDGQVCALFHLMEKTLRAGLCRCLCLLHLFPRIECSIGACLQSAHSSPWWVQQTGGSSSSSSLLSGDSPTDNNSPLSVSDQGVRLLLRCTPPSEALSFC